jgi:hypothetical protein
MPLLQMGLPVDGARLQALVVSEAEPQRQYEEGKRREELAPKTDANGEVLWRIRVVLMGDGQAEVVFVSVPGDPKVKQGDMVRLEELTARAWEMDDRCGITFRASSIRPLQARAQGEKAAV